MLCDVDATAVDKLAIQYPDAKKYADFRKLFDRPNDFDAVVVSTCEHTHAFATMLALRAGKHVYCEKPLTYNISEARLIRETAVEAEARDADGQSGSCVEQPSPRQGAHSGRHDRSGARSTRLGESCVGISERGGRDSGTRTSCSSPSGRRRRTRYRRASTGICGWAPRPRARSTESMCPARNGIAGGTSATAP